MSVPKFSLDVAHHEDDSLTFDLLGELEKLRQKYRGHFSDPTAKDALTVDLQRLANRCARISGMSWVAHVSYTTGGTKVDIEVVPQILDERTWGIRRDGDRFKAWTTKPIYTTFGHSYFNALCKLAFTLSLFVASEEKSEKDRRDRGALAELAYVTYREAMKEAPMTNIELHPDWDELSEKEQDAWARVVEEITK